MSKIERLLTKEDLDMTKEMQNINEERGVGIGAMKRPTNLTVQAYLPCQRPDPFLDITQLMSSESRVEKVFKQEMQKY